MCRGRKEGQHPDNEEVIRDHAVHLREADNLDADTREHLLVAEGKEEFAGDFGGEERSEDDEG